MEFHIISLQDYPERVERVQRIMKEHNLDYHVHLFESTKPGWFGCLTSHLTLIRYAKEKSMKWITIIEDNVIIPRPINKEQYKYLYDFLDGHDEWDIIYIGAFIVPLQTCELYRPHVYRANTCHGTSGYIISQRFYDKMLSLRETVPIDLLYSRHARAFIYNPLMFYRSHDLFSLATPGFQTIRKLWFHPYCMRIVEKLFFTQYLRCITLTFLTVIVPIIILIVILIWKRIVRQIKLLKLK
jgi:GR25 family glycosyltransferase involved in LPS biosynthesis